MSRYSDQVRDEYGRTVPGVSIYVYKWDADADAAGDLETLTDDLSAPLANPLTSDADGLFYFNSPDGQKLIEYHFGGKVEFRDLILVGALPVPQAVFGGLLVNAPALTIPTGMDMIGTDGADALDHGGANYVAGTAPTARSGFTSANSRAMVLSKEQVITPQMFYQATDPDFQNAMQGAFDYLAATAGNTVLTWYRGAPKLAVPKNSTPYLFHAPLEPAFNGIIEGENAGPWTDGTPTQLQWTNGTTGFRGQDINTTGGTGTTVGPGTFAGSGVMLRGMTLIGGLDSDATEGEFHAIHARTRIFVENVGALKWQGDFFHAEADVGSGGANASFSQVSNCRAHHIRHGMYLHGGDSNVINVKSVDVVYARRWGFWDAAFLGNRFEGCHTAAAGIQNPGYLPSVVSNGGNLYAVVAGQEVAASTNAPSGTATDNAYWYYIGAGGVSIPLNNPAWVSGMTVAAGGGYYVSGGGALTTLDDCYGEGGQGPVQMPNLGLAINGTHATGVKGAYLSSRAGRPITLNEFAVEDPANSAIRTQIGSGGNVSGEVFAQFHPAIGGAAGAMSLARPLFSTDIYYLTMDRGSYADNLVPIAFSTNNSTVGNAPWGPNRFNAALGFGFGGKKRYPATVTPATARLVGDIDENTAPTATTPLKWITTVAGTPGTQILHYPYLRANPTVGVGYVTGAGAAVTQLTNKSTATPAINNVCGQVTMNNAALAGGAKVSFVVTNSTVAATDTIIVSVASGGTANAYRAAVTAISAGVSFTVTVENITAGSLSEAPVINFAILKAVAA